MLKLENIKILAGVKDWKEAICTAVQPLVDGGYCEARYSDEIIKNTEKLGPYYVLCENVALIHGSTEQGVIKRQIAITLLKEPVKVELNIVYTTTTKTEWVTDENGVKTLVKNEITKTEFKEGSDTSTGTHTETIINKSGFTLPITGGMGTVLFSIAGFALMAGAAFVLLKGRRKDA